MDEEDKLMNVVQIFINEKWKQVDDENESFVKLILFISLCFCLTLFSLSKNK